MSSATILPDRLSQHVFQLRVTRRLYPGRHVIPGIGAQFGGQALDATRTSGATVALIPKRWLDRFNLAMRPVMSVLDRNTIPMQMREFEDEEDESGAVGQSLLSLRLMPVSARATIFRELTEIQRAVQAVVYELQQAWDSEIINYNREYWEPLLGVHECKRLVLDKLPKVQHLPRRYNVVWGIFSVTSANIEQLRNDEFYGLLEEAQRNARMQIDAAMEAVLTEPRRRVVEALSTLQARLGAEGSRLTDKSFNDTLAAMDLLRSFGDMTEDQLGQQLAIARSAVEEMIRAGENRATGESWAQAIAGHHSTFNAAADALIAQCNDAVAIDRVYQEFGHRGRVLRFQPPTT